MKFNQEEFDRFALDNDVFNFSDQAFRLASGRTSYFYVSWKKIMKDVYLTHKLINFILNFTDDNNLEPDCFYGVPDGATKLGVLCSYELGLRSPHLSKGSHPLPTGRKKAKPYGDSADKYFLGEPRGKVIILEDVTTTGMSLLSAGIKPLIELKESENDLEIIAAVGLTDRLEVTPIPDQDEKETVKSFKKSYEDITDMIYEGKMSVRDCLKSLGIRYLSMSNSNSLLTRAITTKKPEEGIMEGIKSEFKQYGAMDLQIE